VALRPLVAFYATFAETLRAGARIDFAVRFGRLLNLREPHAVAGWTNLFFGQDFMRVFHALNSLNKGHGRNSRGFLLVIPPTGATVYDSV
jgi:hypothetical protein